MNNENPLTSLSSDIDQPGYCDELDGHCDDDDGGDEYGDSNGNGYYGGNVGDKYLSFRDYLDKCGFSRVGSGSFRATYIRGNVVVKVPRNVDGEIDNRTEARAWKKYRDQASPEGIYMAPCRLMVNGCLMMRTVDTTAADDDDVPTWGDMVDGYQIGRYKGGFVAYDFAVEIEERSAWEEEWGVKSEWFHQNRREKEEDNE
jgi:hypothetical protein